MSWVICSPPNGAMGWHQEKSKLTWTQYSAPLWSSAYETVTLLWHGVLGLPEEHALDKAFKSYMSQLNNFHSVAHRMFFPLFTSESCDQPHLKGGRETDPHSGGVPCQRNKSYRDTSRAEKRRLPEFTPGFPLPLTPVPYTTHLRLSTKHTVGVFASSFLKTTCLTLCSFFMLLSCQCTSYYSLVGCVLVMDLEILLFPLWFLDKIYLNTEMEDWETLLISKDKDKNFEKKRWQN